MSAAQLPDHVVRARLIPPARVLAAPMAGGPSTPELVAAVVGAGGGGFLAGGMRTAAQVREQVDALRGLLSGGGGGVDGSDAARRWGVNLFVPDAVNTAIPGAARTERARAERRAAVAAYRERLTAEGERAAGGAAAEGAGGAPTPPSSDDVTPDPARERAEFAAMLAAAEEQAWPLVSFTFGLPEPAVFARLAAAGIPAGVTVTDADEARSARAHGAAFLVVQGHRAGGHRGTLDPAADPVERELPSVLAQVRAVVGTRVPVVAAGGVGAAAHVRSLLVAGADAVAAGTAFLLTAEAGTSAAHRAGIRRCATGEGFVGPDGAARTVLTRAYTGRWARTLATDFAAAHPDAPAAYPELNALTTGLRAAAATAGDLERVHLWAGTQAHTAREAGAADVVAGLTP